MSNHPVYSSLFSTLHDEQHPIGHLGRGSHYSVFRSVEWLDVTRSPLLEAQIHDFAVIWDKDHDTRVISLIEQLYVAGLLSPVQFIGERKGMLTLIVAARFFFNCTEDAQTNYIQRVNVISQNLEDPWSVDVGYFDRAPGDPLGSHHQCDPMGIIMAPENRVLIYLKNIDSLWSLGTKKFIPEPV